MLLVRVFDVIQDLERRPDGTLRIVLMSHRRAEDTQDGVADELVDRSAEVLDHALEQRVIHAEHRLHVFGIGVVRALGEPDQIAEQHGDELPLFAAGPGLERRTALQAEPGAVGVLRPTPRADDHRARVYRRPAAGRRVMSVPGARVRAFLLFGPIARTGGSMDDVSRIVLAMEEHDVAEEVMHFLDRSGHARVVGMAADDRQLLDAIRQLEPDAVVVQPSLVRPDLPQVFVGSLLAVDTQESVAALRSAIHVGASGFFVWPTDREALSRAAALAIASSTTPERRALVVAVHASRGGAGSTFVATHLARAFARRGRACVLVDADPLFGDVGPAVGAPQEGVHTIADLVPLADELAPGHLDEALWIHPDGFRLLLAPPPADVAAVEARHTVRIVEVIATAADVVVVALPRAVDAETHQLFEAADRIVEVLTLDVLSFRSASRAIDLCPPLRAEERVGFVVNRAGRAEVTPGDVQRVFGRAPLAVVPFDRSVPRSQDHGRLRPVRGRSGRAFDRLADQLESGTPR